MIVYYTHKKNSVSKLRKSLTKCNPNTSHYNCYDVYVFVSEGSCVGDLVTGVVTLKNSKAVNLRAPLGCPWVTRVMPLGIKVSPVGSAVDSFLSSSVSPFFVLCSSWHEVLPSRGWADANATPVSLHNCAQSKSLFLLNFSGLCFCYSNRKWTYACPLEIKGPLERVTRGNPLCAVMKKIKVSLLDALNRLVELKGLLQVIFVNRRWRDV